MHNIKQMVYDFANILLAGSCNARCRFCIGKQIDPKLRMYNLNTYPPRSLRAFIERVRAHKIRQVVVTGADTDPQLYHHDARLLETLRHRLPPETQISLHTNGRLALRKINTLNRYDRVCLSIPSFVPATYQSIMGVSGPPKVGLILKAATIPIKLSCLVNEQNRSEIGSFLAHAAGLGVSRVVLRKIYGDLRSWEAILPIERIGLKREGEYRGNPIYRFREMQVTLWDFNHSQSTSINLFSNGFISDQYLLAPKLQLNGRKHPTAHHTPALG